MQYKHLTLAATAIEFASLAIAEHFVQEIGRVVQAE